MEETDDIAMFRVLHTISVLNDNKSKLFISLVKCRPFCSYLIQQKYVIIFECYFYIPNPMLII